MQDVPSPFHSVEAEDAYHAATAAQKTFVPLWERGHGTYPAKFPLPSDRFMLDIHSPVMTPRPLDAGDLTESTRQTAFNRHAYDAKIRSAFIPSGNGRPLATHVLRGHPSSGVGITGRLVVDEINESLGGCYDELVSGK